MKELYGLSSLLFLIPVNESLINSNSHYWKLSLVFVTCASFLCNTYYKNKTLLIFDYFGMFLANMSYVNNFYVSLVMSSFLMFEYIINDDITGAKNISFLFTMVMTLSNTYVNFEFFCILLFSIILSIIVYYIRMNDYDNIIKNDYLNLLFNFTFHSLIATALTISSYFV